MPGKPSPQPRSSTRRPGSRTSRDTDLAVPTEAGQTSCQYGGSSGPSVAQHPARISAPVSGSTKDNERPPTGTRTRCGRYRFRTGSALAASTEEAEPSGTQGERSQVPKEITRQATAADGQQPGKVGGNETVPDPAELNGGPLKYDPALTYFRAKHYHRPWLLDCRVRKGNGYFQPGMCTGRRLNDEVSEATHAGRETHSWTSPAAARALGKPWSQDQRLPGVVADANT